MTPTPALNAIVDELFDLEGAAVDALGKKDLATVLVPDLIKAAEDAISMVPKLGDFSVELAAVKADPATRQALEAYVEGKIAGGSAKVAAIVTVVIQTIEVGFAWQAALALPNS